MAAAARRSFDGGSGSAAGVVRISRGGSAIETQETAQVPRRSFAKYVVLAIIAALVGGLMMLRRWLRSGADSPRMIEGATDLPVGGSLIFQYPADGNPCILIHPAANTYLAFSRICTHNSCPVFYRNDLNEFLCPCHNGVFSAADGSVVQGPPPRPLPRIELEWRGQQIVAVGVSET